jgi:hypothetical protein
MYISSHESDNKTAHEPAIHKRLANSKFGINFVVKLPASGFAHNFSLHEKVKETTET